MSSDPVGERFEYYAVGAPRPRSRPVLTVVSSPGAAGVVAAVCVAAALVAASMLHLGFLLAGAFVAMIVLAAGAWLREGLENEQASDKRLLVESGYLVTHSEVALCDKKDRKPVEKARSAVAVITSSEAATGGWLGDIDFTADLFWIASSAVEASAMQELITKLKPSRRASDKQAVSAGKVWLDARRKKLDERVKLLEDAAKHARAVDERLRRQQEASARLALRDEESARMAGLRTRLVGNERPNLVEPSNEAVEAIRARAEAFYDVDAINRRVAGDDVVDTGGVLGWLRRRL
ncbi:hypothetical protein [Williamsia sp. 1135]|uniref:hypothetical protein n=1 Tax=Williamsia sp. 1135 TaxID=1889262 RepID=UPI00117C961E|nr:hypothetical protein [Williamsia sp. 1135]